MLGRWFPPWWRSVRPSGPYARLRIGLVADELTSSCLAFSCNVVHLTPSNYAAVLRGGSRPDFVFVESAWQGFRQRWKYRIAAYPDHPERNNAELIRLLDCANDAGIPTVFWNKEDSVHFDRFIDSARHASLILTVDAGCVDRYRAEVGEQVRIGVLPFAVQPLIHRYAGIDSNRRSSCFVGSYGTHIHDVRRTRQDLLLGAAAQELGVNVYDRNSDRRAKHYRFPVMRGQHIRAKVPHAQTAAIYKRHLACLNVNTIEDSPTMLSRRLLEILACGGLAVSTPAMSINRHFEGCCHLVDSKEQAEELFAHLARDGYDKNDRAMMEEGVQRVLGSHTYDHRLSSILDFLATRIT